MSAIDCSRLSTEELIKRFVELACRVGGAFSFDFRGKPHPRSPEAQAIKKELRAIAEVLKERKPIAALRQLFDHESPDVRSWASGQFMSMDPEWADASTAGIEENLTATEVMALRARALTRPPLRPTLQEMSVDQLVARFEDACIRRYGAQFVTSESGLPEPKNRNRLVEESGRIVQELTGRGALNALLPMLDHPNFMVRYVAATYCLPMAPARAISILESVVARKDPIESMHAANTLDRWRRGVYGGSAR